MSSPAENRHEAPDVDPEDKAEVDLSSLLDLQIERQTGESKRATRVIIRVCGLLLAAGLVSYAVSPNQRRKVDGLIQNVKESRHDLDQIAHPTELNQTYDEILDKLGSRSTDIDTATRSLGVDPTTVEEDGMDPEMKEMMGGEGRTAGERERMVEGIAHLAGVKLPKPPHAAPAGGTREKPAPAE